MGGIMDIRITGKDYMEEMLRLQSRVKELETKVEKFENGITYYDKVQELVSRILNMESDLTLNASMLARQCDLAREAEARVSNLLSQHEIASQQIQIWEARVKELEDQIRKMEHNK
jgi:polyhydroxyalkanoate synthesis regulator phasin